MSTSSSRCWLNINIIPLLIRRRLVHICQHILRLVGTLRQDFSVKFSTPTSVDISCPFLKYEEHQVQWLLEGVFDSFLGKTLIIHPKKIPNVTLPQDFDILNLSKTIIFFRSYRTSGSKVGGNSRQDLSFTFCTPTSVDVSGPFLKYEEHQVQFVAGHKLLHWGPTWGLLSLPTPS